MNLRDETLDQKWVSAAKCIGEPTADWYPVRDPLTYPVIAARAKAVCNGKDNRAPCTVRKQCLLWAFIGNKGEGELAGIWGGMSHRERNAMERKAIASGKTVQEYIEEKF